MRSSSFLVVLLAGFAGGFALSSCGTTGSGSCNATTCGGCCDSTGKCQPGTAAAACGVEGATCGRCGSGTVCAQGTCSALGSGGGDGSGGGGGSPATGGGVASGGGPGCRQIASLSLPDSAKLDPGYIAFSSGGGHYIKASWAVAGLTQATPDAFRLEVVYPNDVGPVPPVTQSFTAVGYKDCSICAVYYENCNQMLTCEKTYLARSGSVSLARADKVTVDGGLTGSLSNVHFVEWNIEADVAEGTGCVDFPGSASFTTSW